MNHHALSALKEKRSTFAGEIIDFEKRAARRRAQFSHLDAVIKIMDPAFDLDSLPVKHVSTKPKMFGRGEITRVVYDILRTASGPLTVPEITNAAMPMLGKDETQRMPISRQIRNKLNYHMTKRQTVKRVGEGRDARWSLV